MLIAHLDADCFYVSAERVRDPFLLGKPDPRGTKFDSIQRPGSPPNALNEAGISGIVGAFEVAIGVPL